MTVLLVALGAAVGAPLRYLTDRAMRARFGPAIPWGTFVVNVVGSFVLGLVAGTVLEPAVVAVVGIGFCGALTTYSTFAYESAALSERRARVAAVVNVVGSVLAGVAAAAAGWMVGLAL